MRYLIRKCLLIITIILGWINLPAQAFLLSNHQDLWQVISQNFYITNHTDNSHIRQQIDRDLTDRQYIHQLTENARPFVYYVYHETLKMHLPAELALLPMIESEYTPSGRSNKGAVGLWQLMPRTANNYGIKMNMWYDGRQNTVVSTKAALDFLAYLYGQFHHNWLLAIAAYNAGPGAVMAAIHYNQQHGRPTDFWALRLPEQTREYIPKLLALASIIQHPKTYGVHLSPVPNKPLTSTVIIKKQMPLKTIAHFAHTSIYTVKKLNPGLKRSQTPPHQTLALVLPINKKHTFVSYLETAKKTKATLTQKKANHYTVRHGDSLSTIASKFKTSTHTLKDLNQIQSEFLQGGQTLLIPAVITETAKELVTAEGKNTKTKKPIKAITKKIQTKKPIKQTKTKKILRKKIHTAKRKTIPTKTKTTTHKKIALEKEHTYIVRSGDNLHSIAARFNTTTYHIMQHNHLKTSNLKIGQHLLLPHA